MRKYSDTCLFFQSRAYFKIPQLTEILKYNKAYNFELITCPISTSRTFSQNVFSFLLYEILLYFILTDSWICVSLFSELFLLSKRWR